MPQSNQEDKLTLKLCTETKPKTSAEAVKAALNETPENHPTLIPSVSLGTTNDQRREALALLTNKKWENGRTLRVWFDKAGKGVVERVKPYFLEWTNHANISFQFVSDRNIAEIRVGFVQGEGSWSYLGTDNLTIPTNEHTMMFGWLTPNEDETEFKRVVLHEVGHALGAIHEHQNPSGGIPWDRAAVIKYYSGPPNNWSLADIESNLFERYAESQSNFTDLDRKSIMAYPVPNEFTLGDYFIPFNTDLSEQDKTFIRWCYPKPSSPPVELPTMSITRFVLRGVAEKTGILKRKKKFAIAEPWNE
jgi:hypothetical protein